jgi:hypothetical protein
MTRAGRALYSLLLYRKRIAQLSAKLNAQAAAAQAVEARILLALRAGRKVECNGQEAELGTERTRARPSLTFLTAQLGAEAAERLWTGLPVKTKELVLVKPVAAATPTGEAREAQSAVRANAA